MMKIKFPKIDWKTRLRQKWFLAAIASGTIMTLKTAKVIEVPDDWNATLDAILYAFVAVGLVLDPTTPGLSDGEHKG